MNDNDRSLEQCCSHRQSLSFGMRRILLNFSDKHIITTERHLLHLPRICRRLQLDCLKFQQLHYFKQMKLNFESGSQVTDILGMGRRREREGERERERERERGSKSMKEWQEEEKKGEKRLKMKKLDRK